MIIFPGTGHTYQVPVYLEFSTQTFENVCLSHSNDIPNLLWSVISLVLSGGQLDLTAKRTFVTHLSLMHSSAHPGKEGGLSLGPVLRLDNTSQGLYRATPVFWQNKIWYL